MSSITASHANVSTRVPFYSSRDRFTGVFHVFCLSFEPDDLCKNLFMLSSRPNTQYASVVVKKEEKCIDRNEMGVKMKSLQDRVFPGGHPSKY